MELINTLRNNAKVLSKTIVLPESEDVRTLKAAAFLSKESLCKVILIGDEKAVRKNAEKQSISLPDDVQIISFDSFGDSETLVAEFQARRAHKGLTLEQAEKIISTTPLYFAAMLVATGNADGCVAGAVNTTGDVLRAAIQGIGLKKGSDIVSSIFLMHTRDGKTLTYGDCAVVPYPDSTQLASIAIDSAETHKSLIKEDPRVAMLSFSTKGSARHERVDIVTEALKLVQEKRPDLKVDGELQFDAAFMPDIGERKAPGSGVAGKANVYVFPNIDAGNIGYKISERLGGATAIGPIIQGLAKPMNDLSRGCSWEDIVNTACVTAQLQN